MEIDRIQELTPGAYWSIPSEDLLDAMKASRNGLDHAEAARRLKIAGPNVLEIRDEMTPFRLLLRQVTNPLVLILLFAAFVSVFAREWADAIVIAAIVAGSGLISFFQEYRAENAIAGLRRRLRHQVVALRNGGSFRTPVDAIVPGDVVSLSAGSLVPADGVLLESQDLFVNQAALTGETFAVIKEPGVAAPDSSLADRTNCLFTGTSVRSGTCHLLVTRTGISTEYGRIADRLSRRRPETEFDRGIRKFGIVLGRIMVGLVLFVFAANVVSFKPPLDSLLFAIALAVGISPELLPAIISINLAKGARAMARHGVIVRRLEAIENLGSMDVLCTDKTGTLTEGVVRLDVTLDAAGNHSAEVSRLAYLNAYYQAGLTNPLDEAILLGNPIDLSTSVKTTEVPYDFSRKRLSVVVRDGDAVPELITKGALENVLAICTRVRISDGDRELCYEERSEILRRFEAWSTDGFRVLGIAAKAFTSTRAAVREDECDSTFRGFLLFFDPPKEGVTDAIKALEGFNVKLKIISGDNRYVARHIAEAVGLPKENALSGPEIDQLSEEALWHAVGRTNVFSEVDPNQKQRIIRALQRIGHVVGYMGDGINDAPALHDADVGISVEGAVDVAREGADIVLLHKGLNVLTMGIEEGRITFANSLKYILTTTSANFGNMLSMAAASLFLPFLPLVAKQVLLNNFLSDIPALAIANDNVDREFLARPHRWDIRFIRNFMVIFGLVSSIFDLLTFGLLIYIVQANEEVFRTTWFIQSLLTELFVALIVRTRRAFYRSKPGRLLWILTILVACLALAIPYLPYMGTFGFVPLPPELMLLIGVVTAMYLVATEAVKRSFYRRFGTEQGEA